MATININLRLPEDLHAELKRLAAEEQRSLNNLIVRMLTGRYKEPGR
jgi:predicted HicB family RNase H-like nuclease